MANIVNTGVFVGTVSQTTQTLSTTLSAGSRRKVVVMIGAETITNVTGVTYDGEAMTQVTDASINNATDANLKTSTWYYDVPDAKGAASYNVVVTQSGNNPDISFYYWQLASAATGAPEAAAETQWTTTATNATLSPVATTNATLLSLALTGAASQTWAFTGDVTERTESNETNYTTAVADATGVSSGTKTITATVSSSGTGNKCLIAVSVALSAGPTITVQPVAQRAIFSNGNTATFGITATGTGGLTYDWELENGVGSGVYADVADGNGATWTGRTTTSLVGTFTAKTLSGRRLRCNVTDDNGTTTSTAVALTLFDGPQVTTFPATNGSGVSTATLTCDYVTGVGEAIEVRIPLADGDVAVTVTTT